MAEDGAGGRPPVTRSAIALLIAVVASAVLVFGALVQQSRRRPPQESTEQRVVVSLGEAFACPPAGPAQLVMKLSLEVDAGRADRERLRAEIERRRAQLRSIVILEVLGRKRAEDLNRREALVETLLLEIRDRVNRELQAELGSRVIRDVVVEDLVMK